MGVNVKYVVNWNVRASIVIDQLPEVVNYLNKHRQATLLYL